MNGERYVWEMRPYGGATSLEDKHRGVAIRIRAKDGRERELILTLITASGGSRKPRPSAGIEQQIREGIAAALKLGWRPDSRGKPFRVDFDEAS